MITCADDKSIVTANNCYEEINRNFKETVKCGAPQRSVMCPLLYCICTVHVIRSLNCQYQHMHNFVTG